MTPRPSRDDPPTAHPAAAVQPLSGMDAAFLYAETRRGPINVLAHVMLGPVAGRPVDVEAVLDRLQQRISLLPPFRRKLAETPLGLDHPVWVEERELDVRDHVRRIRVAAPGSRRELETWVARAAARRLDRSRPLWELWVVEGLEGGRTALVFRARRAAVGGVTGAAVLLHLFDGMDARDGRGGGEAGNRAAGDDEARGGSAEGGPTADPLAAPGEGRVSTELPAGDLVVQGLRRLPGRARDRARAFGELGRSALRLARASLAPEAPLRDVALPFAAPETPLNGPLSPRRDVSYARASMDDLQATRRVLGGKINDLVMAACTRGLRELLLSWDSLPDRPLLAAIPVSTRSALREDLGGNQISAMLVELPVHLEDPVHALAEVMRASRRAKRFHSILGERTLESLADLVAPALFRGAARLYAGWGLASRHRPLYNLMISNVPGPSQRLSLCGAEAESLVPHGPVLEGAGLNITVMSYGGALDVGVLACADALPHAHTLASGIAAGFEELAKHAARLEAAASEDLPPGLLSRVA